MFSRQLQSLQVLFAVLFPYSQQVNLLPHGEIEGVVGGNVSFFCISSRDSQNLIRWTINGNSTVFPDNANISVEDGSRVQILHFFNLTLKNNASTISCIAYNSTTSQASNEVTLLISPGVLGGVGSLEVTLQTSMLITTWTPPPVLGVVEGYNPNLTTYCVELDSSVSRVPLLFQCGINVTQFAYHLPARSWCQRFTITVTPQNAVAGGPGRSVTYFTTNIRPEVLNHSVSQLITFLMSAPVCNADLTFMNINTGEIIVLQSTDFNISESNITFTSQQLNASQQLQENCLFNVTVAASNIAGLATSYTILDLTEVCMPSSVTEQYLTIPTSPPTSTSSVKKRVQSIEIVVTVTILNIIHQGSNVL